MNDEAEIYDMQKAREKFAASISPKKGDRKARAKRLTGSVDGRSLRSSGRTAQFNFKSTPGLHQRAKDAATRAGKPLAEWMEELVEAALAADAGGDDA